MDSRILPADLPNSKLNDYNYEQGFDEHLLLNSEYADCFSCPICHGIPRSPVIIMLCGHLFCECCVEKQFEAAKLQDYDERDVNQCAVCKGHFQKMSVLPFEYFYTALKKAYHLVRLRCPNGCAFIGDPQKWLSMNHFNEINARCAVLARDVMCRCHFISFEMNMLPFVRS